MNGGRVSTKCRRNPGFLLERGFLVRIIHENTIHTWSISISQSAYLKHVLERFGMTDCNPAPTPIALGTPLTKQQAPLTGEDCQFMANKPYREILGSIMYAQIATQPDLSYAISTLSKFVSNPGRPHWIALMRVLRYIKGTLDFKITYGGKGYTNLAPIGYVDADYAGDVDTRRSCSGHVFLQAGGPSAWGSQYQQTVALSTTEAEYMAMSRAAKQMEFMYSSMDKVGYPQTRPADLYNDNAGAVSLTKNTKGNTRVKHIDVRHHYICDMVEDGKITIHHIPPSDNLADVFTKPLGRDAHRRACIGMRLTSGWRVRWARRSIRIVALHSINRDPIPIWLPYIYNHSSFLYIYLQIVTTYLQWSTESLVQKGLLVRSNTSVVYLQTLRWGVIFLYYSIFTDELSRYRI